MRDIDKFEKQLDDWRASDRTDAYPHNVYMDAIEARVQQLVDLGFTGLDTDLALFAIKSYARQNFIAHGGAFDISKSECFAGLAKYLERDDKTLEDVLPDEELPMAGEWRRLLTFYKDVHIRQGEGGNWERQTPLKQLLGSLSLPPGRPWGAALRIKIEMGEYRPAGLDGPPPCNVSWDPSSFRFRSEPENRGLKRPATEQSSEPPRVKRARVANHLDSTLEIIPNSIKHSDALGHQISQMKLHLLTTTLAQHTPKVAAKLLLEYRQKLDGELDSLRRSTVEKYQKRQPRSQEYVILSPLSLQHS